MGLIKKIKLWWKTTPTAEKIMVILGGVSATASVAGAVYAVHEVKNLKAEVNLYPGGKDDPNPVNRTPDEPRPVIYTSPEDVITCAPSPSPMITADMESEKWEVWNPEWELLWRSKSGYESVRLADALDVLLRQDDGLLSEEDVTEAEARVEDLARQFAYLEGSEDDFRQRFPFLKTHAGDIYENVAEDEKKGE